MKKFILIISIILLIKVSLFSQQFVSEENSWNVVLVSFPRSINTEIFKIDGDSVVSSVEYKKIWVSYDSLETWFFQGLLRENMDTVWFIKDDTVEHVLYNFNLIAGDTTFITNGFVSDKLNEVYVEQVDTVEVFGVNRKRLLLVSVENGTSDYWIDGIGSLSGPLYSMYMCNIICPSWDLICCHKGDTLIYMRDGEDDCWLVGIDEKNTNPVVVIPNPVLNGHPLEINSSSSVIECVTFFDQSGKAIKKVEGLSVNHFIIETAGYKSGVYLLKIKLSGNKILTRKIVLN